MNPKRVCGSYNSYTLIGIIIVRVYDPNFRVHVVPKVPTSATPSCWPAAAGGLSVHAWQSLCDCNTWLLQGAQETHRSSVLPAEACGDLECRIPDSPKTLNPKPRTTGRVFSALGLSVVCCASPDFGHTKDHTKHILMPRGFLAAGH